MKPMVVIFKTMEEFDQLMRWASREHMLWCSRTHPADTTRAIHASVQGYLHRKGQCALRIDEHSRMGYSSVGFHREYAPFNSYEFKTAQEVLSMDINCTIPEEKETT